jgi:hypothetical protein
MAYETKVGIHVQDIREMRDYEVIFTVNFPPGVPHIDTVPLKKDQIGYHVFRELNGRKHLELKKKFHHQHHTSIKPAYFLQGDTYKLVLESGDDARTALESIAHILVEAQGQSELQDEPVIQAGPELELTYGNPDLEARLERI